MSRLPARVLALLLLCIGPAWAGAAPSTPPDLAAIHATLAGTWQSTDDTKFTRELDADGRAADHYEGDESATTAGHWSLFLGSTPPAGLAGRKLVANAVYLLLDENGDSLLFGLVSLNPSELKMVYIERGNLLSFVRLK